MKNECFLDFALIRRLFKSPSVRRRMAVNYLGIRLTAFVSDLHARGYTREGVRHHVLVVEHFGRWLQHRQVQLRRLSTFHVLEFLRSHLPRCRCPRPAPKVQPDGRASLRRFVEFLRSQRWIKEPAEKTAPQGPVDRLMAAYEGHLDRVCGLSAETRRRRQLLARQFLRWRFGRKQPQLERLQAKQVSSFVFSRAHELAACRG